MDDGWLEGRYMHQGYKHFWGEVDEDQIRIEEKRKIYFISRPCWE